MKLTKRLILTVLILAIFTSCFAGCKNNAEVSTDALEVVTIWGNGAGVNVDAKIAQEYNETIGKEKGVKIDFQAKEGDVSQQISIALQSGNAPDLFGGGKIKEFSQKGYIAPISKFKGGKEFVDNAVKHGSAYSEDVNVSGNEAYTVSLSVLTFGLVYNKDMFKAAGIVDENGEATPPKTWDELREYAKKLTDKSKRQYGIILPLKWSGWYDYEVYDCGFQTSPNFCFDPDTMQYDFSQLNPILNTIIGIKNDESYYPGAEGIDNDPARARFAEGNVGMKFAVSWDTGVFKEQFPAKFDWGVAPLPLVDENVKYPQYIQKNNGTYINAKVLGTEREDIVFDVWKFWNGEERQKKLYKEGISLPTDFEYVKDVETDIKGWKEFAQLLEISQSSPKRLKYTASGKKTLKEMFINDVWNGNMTVEEATAQFTKTANEGIIEYYKTSDTTMEEMLKLKEEQPELFRNLPR